MSYEKRDVSPPGGPSDEYRLVVQAQGGDQAAFEALYERYNDRICRYLIRMVGNDGVGCELTQETFMKAWEMLLTLRDPARFAGWIYRIATNRAYNYQNRAKHFHMIPWDMYQASEGAASIAGPERQVEETELLTLALARVSPTYRPCLILYVVEELSQRQIAELLKMKESSVGKYVSRGREELRQVYYRLTGERAGTTRGDRQGL
ncbi:MAG: RNA polymerase sigma factor [Ktedonobacteraceae bacterium]|nr:RNA polymerase sigma factor [Ktedonobacteraceae bacterium]